MPRKLEFTYEGKPFEAAIHKVDRTKLYGSVEVETLDSEGERCGLATLANDGRTLIPYGGTAFGYVNTEGLWVDRGDLVAVDLDGDELPKVESSFSQVTELSREATVEEFLDHSVRLCYQLESDFDPDFVAALGAGKIFRLEFSYRGGVVADPAFILQGGDETIWLLVGVKNEFSLIGLEQAGCGQAPAEQSDDEAASGDDFDFDML